METRPRCEIADMQARFVAALRTPSLAVPDDVTAPEASLRERRFNVYRNTVHASLAAALAARFPVVERLVGDEFFRAMALVFIDEAPPASPILSRYGAAFPAFLEVFEPARELPYLADVARLEWARSEAYHAADAAAIAIDVLARVAPEALSDVRLIPHPAARLVASVFPVCALWATNTHDAEVKPIALDAGGEAAVVTRPQLEVLVTPISQGSRFFFEALSLGATLGEVIERTSLAVPSFAAGESLAELFVSGAFAGLLLPSSNAE